MCGCEKHHNKRAKCTCICPEHSNFQAAERETTPIHDAVAVDQMRAELADDATVRRLFADD